MHSECLDLILDIDDDSSLICISSLFNQIISLLQSRAGGEETLLRLALKAADMGLLLGAPLPPPNESLDLTVAASLLSSTLAQVIEQSGSELGMFKLSFWMKQIILFFS